MFFGFNREDVRIMFNIFKLNVRDRYLGSRFGMLWSLINPLLIMAIYIYVFGFVFNSRLPGSEKSITYVIWLISGFAPWLAISDGIVSSTNSVVAGSSLVKNIAFKSELLPIAAAMVGIFPMTVGLVVLIVLLIIEGSGISIHLLWLLLIIPIQMLFLAGVGFFLSAWDVFVRDIGQIISSALMLILFFTPIFYPVESLPGPVQKLTVFNPFHHLVQSFRNVLVYHTSPDLEGLCYVACVILILWYLGLKFFRRLKGSFESCL